MQIATNTLKANDLFALSNSPKIVLNSSPEQSMLSEITSESDQSESFGK